MAIIRSFKPAAILSVVALVSVATACSAGSQSAGSDIKAVDCDVSGAGNVKVSLLSYNSSATDPFSNALVKSCSKDGVEVKHAPIDFAGQYQKTATTLAGGQGTYDIIGMYSGAVPGYASTEKLMPLGDLFDKYADEYGLDELDPIMLEGMSYDGELYALPTMSNVMTLVYREDVFEELDLEPPTTYDEMVTAAEKIQDAGEIKSPLALPLADNSSTMFEQLLRAQGGGYLDPKTKKPALDTPEAKTALQTLADLRPLMDPEVAAFDQPRVQQQLMNGKAAMAIMYSGRMADLSNPKLTPYAENFAFAAPPALEKGGPIASTVSVDGWSIPANTDIDADLLFRMMAASVSAEASSQAVPAAFPAREGIATEENTRYAAAVQEALAGGAATPPMETWLGNMQNATSPLLLQAIIGQTSVDEALAASTASAEKALTD
ncbi:ABC transporter substrate-binding protein [Nocardioides panzhihuensis]|uniref:Sorbitol/mannitol transport system substrate-binding protein n=1 Tax=Nocardioides panzhihuensis TaxID=860243 RepID=A0A7Z0ITI9_9ACTN|nr:sugar ABC transporter substrate-binding protein [Nocardioides panzhihuensis]NYI78907.1 sorbitol/mannitol transport system substrate-binding protein [Nocardioides panzhihuensis]